MAALHEDPARASAAWEPLIGALRDELQEFGGLIRLLKEEQDAILANPSGVTDVPEAIARQRNLALSSTRTRRELMLVTGSGGHQVRASAPEIIDSAPGEMRPLLGALFAEVEKLALRAGESVSQNEWLRKRAPILAATMAARCATEKE